MARRFGEGDWSARVAKHKLPAEFVPLARAFNAMAYELMDQSYPAPKLDLSCPAPKT